MSSLAPLRRWESRLVTVLLVQGFVLLFLPVPVDSWVPRSSPVITNKARQQQQQQQQQPTTTTILQGATDTASDKSARTAGQEDGESPLFLEFVEFLKQTQTQIIQQIEEMDGSGKEFSNDPWGVFDTENTSSSNNNNNNNQLSGGITRVLQGGTVVEKGACSLTLIRRGILTMERAAAIRARQDDADQVQPGDSYSAAALSIVFHSKSPMVPTFRSDVRIFVVQSQKETNTAGAAPPPALAWFGGGADLTPYYLFDEDVTFFHDLYRDVCQGNNNNNSDDEYSYDALKRQCDEYFYLPARSEHRGTGGIFFDDMAATPESLAFVKGVATAWMPSWLPIIQKRQALPFTEQQKQWQLLRRGRYLEFNLLYDRGVKFGLANANPRVEGVMVSAPPLIAWEYNHKIEEESEEARLMKILKEPKQWATQ